STSSSSSCVVAAWAPFASVDTHISAAATRSTSLNTDPPLLRAERVDVEADARLRVIGDLEVEVLPEEVAVEAFEAAQEIDRLEKVAFEHHAQAVLEYLHRRVGPGGRIGRHERFRWLVLQADEAEHRFALQQRR